MVDLELHGHFHDAGQFVARLVITAQDGRADALFDLQVDGLIFVKYVVHKLVHFLYD